MEFEKGDIETNLTHSIICLRLLNRVSSYDKVKYHFFYEATTNTLNQAFLQRCVHPLHQQWVSFKDHFDL